MLDYSELIHRAVILAQQPSVQAKLQTEFKAVFMNEYQNTDPNQTKLLQTITSDGHNLIAISDPNQSIYTFHGTNVRNLLQFTDEFRTRNGTKTAQITLNTTHRFKTTLQRISQNVVHRLGIPKSLNRNTFERFHNPNASACVYDPGKIKTNLYSTSGAELEHIANLLHRAHIQNDIK